MPKGIVIRTSKTQLIALGEGLAKLQCCAQCADNRRLISPLSIELVGFESSTREVCAILYSFLPLQPPATR